MITEQLQAARAAHWRQNQSPLLTLDDAQSWFQQHPLCLYLPRHAQLPAPAPSFVEACVGSRQTMPTVEAREQAQALLIRLIANHTVVPLNLFGSVSEQPDFLAHSDALPYVLSLRADADWKHAPQKSSGHAVSPLVLELWKALDKEGGLTAAEARQTLGRELTEAAVLRGLCELWQTVRVSPVFFAEGEPVRWEMLRVHHRAALATAGSTGQVTAISLLVSMYLQSVYAATSDEIEIFLSPVASRSRVREAVRGLAATRQIHSLSMDAQTYYFIEGGLPAFAEVSVTAPAEPAMGALDKPRRPLPAPRKVQATRPAGEPIFRRPRPAVPPAMRPERAPARPAARTAASAPDRKAWQPAAKPYRPKPYGQSPAAGGRERSAQPSSAPPKRPYSPRGPGAERRTGQASPRNAQPGSGAPGAPARRPYARPGATGAKPGGGPRPETRGNVRPGNRPGAWTGGAKRDTPKPWALPGRKSGAPPRPPRPGARRDAPFRPRDTDVTKRPADAQRERPDRSADRPRRAPFPARALGPAGKPAERSSYRKENRPRPAGAGAAPAARPYVRPGTRPDSRPGSKPEERGAPRRTDRPRPPQAGASARPFRPSGGPPRGVGTRPPRGGGPGTPGERPRPAGRPAFSPRPRPGGSADRKGGTGPRPPFVPGRPARSPGKPPANFRDRKPNDRKPGRRKPGE